MNPTAAGPMTRLPPGLPTVVMGDGTRCLVDKNTIWIPAGYPLPVEATESVVPQATAVQPSPWSGHREMMPVCQLPISLPSSEQDLQLMRPEAFSCVLPQLDLPCPGPQPQSVHVVTPATTTTSSPEPNVQQKLKSELKPCKRKPRTFTPKPQPKPRIPKEKVSKSRPESKPYFVPQPLGAKHIKPPSKNLGNRITKSLGDHGIIKPSTKLSFTEQLKSADHAYLKPKSVLSSTGCKTLPVTVNVKKVKDKVVSESESAESGDVTVAKDNVNAAKAVDKAEPNSGDEYDVEYLYLTKLILRKKKKPIAEPSMASLPSCKRKCPDDSSEMPQAVKQARLEEPQDTLEDLEALLAEYSNSLMSGTRDFF